jgi:hypothetical protein
VSQTIGRPLVMQLGHERGTAFMVKHPGELEERTRVERNIIAGRVSLWRRLGVLSGGGDAYRFFVLAPGDADQELAFGSFFVRGPFRVALKTNNSHEAQLAFARFQPRDPTADDLIRYLARGKGGAATEWMIAEQLLIEPETMSKALERLGRERVVVVAGPLSSQGYAWRLGVSEDEARNRARALDTLDVPLVALANETS